MGLIQAKRSQINQIFCDFLRNRARTIRHLRIEDLNINPFLIRILAKEMNVEDAESIVRWLVVQRSMTGANTSFGFCLQGIAKLFTEGTGVEGADIQKSKDNGHYHIQVKSGPRLSQRLKSSYIIIISLYTKMLPRLYWHVY